MRLVVKIHVNHESPRVRRTKRGPHNSNVEISIKCEVGNRSLQLAITEMDTTAISGLLRGTQGSGGALLRDQISWQP